eukprot:gene6252-52_t
MCIIGIACAAQPVFTVATGRLPLWFVEASLCIIAVGVLLADWTNSTYPGSPRVWPFQVITLDILLVVNARVSVTKGVVALTCAWLGVTAAENAFRFGLFDLKFAQSSQELFRQRTDGSARMVKPLYQPVAPIRPTTPCDTLPAEVGSPIEVTASRPSVLDVGLEQKSVSVVPVNLGKNTSGLRRNG